MKTIILNSENQLYTKQDKNSAEVRWDVLRKKTEETWKIIHRRED
jgi:hypothetical protein